MLGDAKSVLWLGSMHEHAHRAPKLGYGIHALNTTKNEKIGEKYWINVFNFF